MATPKKPSKRTQPRSDTSYLSGKLKEKLDSLNEEDRLKFYGYGNGKKIEPVPNFIKADCEKVISGENNTWITLGRDRPRSLFSGYGGSGDSHAGAIDICVGRAGKMAKETDNDGKDEEQNTGLIIDGLLNDGKVPEELLQVNNDFKSDAARIYISQKTDIDYNFGIAPGKQLSPSPRSAIGMKADLVRVVARESIKLVTRTDDENSQKGKVDVVGGIDLIAGNDDSDLQPLVKGKNLQELLSYLIDDIKRLASLVHQMNIANQALETIVMNHVHLVTTPPTPVSPPVPIGVAVPSVEVQVGTAVKSISDLVVSYPSQISIGINSVLEEYGYLKPLAPKHILSEKNNTN